MIARKKKATSQSKWRQKKKDEHQQEQLSMSTPLTSPTTQRDDLRKKEGQRHRRANMFKSKSENNKLRETVRKLTKEIRHLNTSRSSTPSPCKTPAEVFFDNVSPNAKQRVVLRLKDKKACLPRGSSEGIRREFGINLSKQHLPKTISPSPLQITIENFLCRDDISKLCPDKNKQVNNHQVRYRLNHLSVLHQQFELENKIDIDYVIFTRYVPSYIQKPNHDSWGTGLCMTCLNPQLKHEKLHQLKNKYSCIKSVVETTPNDIADVVKDALKIDEFKDNLLTLNREKIILTYCEWQKKISR